LSSLPELPKVKTLQCRYCSGLSSLPELQNVETLHCNNCPSLSSLPELPNIKMLDFFGTQIKIDLQVYYRKWQELGLMPEDQDGIIVWKHVSPGLKGNMKFQYEIDQPFKNDGMCCAGPFGAIKEYNLYKDNPHLLAIRATHLSIVDSERGIYFCYEGIPLALYQVRNLTNESGDLILIRGTETEAIRSIFE
jgi:hypothetical protein